MFAPLAGTITDAVGARRVTDVKSSSPSASARLNAPAGALAMLPRSWSPSRDQVSHRHELIRKLVWLDTEGQMARFAKATPWDVGEKLNQYIAEFERRSPLLNWHVNHNLIPTVSPRTRTALKSPKPRAAGIVVSSRPPAAAVSANADADAGAEAEAALSAALRASLRDASPEGGKKEGPSTRPSAADLKCEELKQVRRCRPPLIRKAPPPFGETTPPPGARSP